MNKFPFDTQTCELQLTSYSFAQTDLMVKGFIKITDENKKDSVSLPACLCLPVTLLHFRVTASGPSSTFPSTTV